MDFSSPNEEWGGADPRSYKSHDGTYFHGDLEKDADGVLKVIVWHTDAGGAPITSWGSGGKWAPGMLGQGGLVLQGDGSLTVQGFVGYGPNQTRRILDVPDWQPWPAPAPVGGGLSYDAFLALARQLVADADKPTDAARFFVEFVNKRGAMGAKWLVQQVLAAAEKALG